ncbi:MAG: imidazole glycerol phosphate synthase subunit HisF [Gammaproteobacteria bacterium]|nr:imidazole glycerol phosphate synthase subunit HisF [Gammaproteobacteria bacterium]|tara:strand:- start:1062 stop:1874 length:813 start_codon:yes stop_codon:yes gene_type:complete
MLKHRLIPSIILNNGNVVQSVNFKHTNVIGNAITAVDFFNNWAVDEIIILDVSRSNENREKFHKIISGLSKRCFVPLCVGGWVQDTDEINKLLTEGADKICINTKAIQNPEFITDAANTFGSQCIVVSIDVKRNSTNQYEVISNRGQTYTRKNPVEWAKRVEELGAGEIFLTSIDCDGKRDGYDLEIIKDVSENVSIPVIAFGGVGNWQHFVEGIQQGKADAVSAANIFHYSEHSTFNAKQHMINSGLNVRIPKFYKIPTPRKPKYNEIY